VDRAVYVAPLDSSSFRIGHRDGKSSVTDPISCDVLPGIFPLERMGQDGAAETSANSTSNLAPEKLKLI
jgi:hypothetical protein